MSFICTARPKRSLRPRSNTGSAIYATMAKSNAIAFTREICHDFSGDNTRSRRIQERTGSRFLEGRKSRGHGTRAEESCRGTGKGISADHRRRENFHEGKNAVDKPSASQRGRLNFSEGHD